ncbi:MULTISPECIES: leucine-rich repeat protein [unclassified Apibacter]|uniref:leucine-rich repeat protein n=1 Tax=unclassified Apibacter TaxID=2630820 RepID=UPI0013264F5F|nr:MULTISPECIES: leucine-rich repeat protein [unclassified Apibacter]MCX8677704.1 leucine-rich repeat protein [Apibacter sp. B3919]MXO24980.1 leucine-rich repeat protein [Apibacter sp. B3924]MXO27269.1 leucine-rich repeat protein [Apibacter sp. B3813]MXO29082.1 leucine-rich repeat protein [Apibacter sp. B3913]MXO31137.1 leucine-rich repeat protein [Apibacter sp. B3912]
MKKFIFFMLSIFLIGAVCHAQVYKELDVKLPGTLSQLVTSDKSKITHLKLTGSISNEDIKTIREMSALNNLDLTKVKLSDNNLPKGAFSNFKGHISLPATLKVIPSNTFISYSGSITLPSALETIEHKAFLAAKIDKLDFSNTPNLHTIDYSAFEGLTLTTTNNTLDFSKNLKLNSFLPYGSSVAGPFTGFVGNVILPNNLKKISNLMFAQFSGSITLPAALETIEHKAFIYSKIDKLDFSSTPNLNTINYSAFERLTLTKTNNTLDFSKNLKLNSFLPYGSAASGPFTGFVGNVILPNNLKEISNLMFSQFTGSVILPSALETIEQRAFLFAKIDKLDFSSTPNLSTIKDRAFEGLQITTDKTINFLKNIKLKSFPPHVNSASGTFSNYTGHVILPINLTRIYSYMFSKFNGSVCLPVALRVIDHRAFLYANIDKLDFCKSIILTEIKDRAFENLNLTENKTLDFSKNCQLNTFSSNPGSNTGSFTFFTGNVVLPQHLKKISSLTFSQFRGNVTLPPLLEIIEDNAFIYAKMKEIVIPSTVNYIGNSAFIENSTLEKIFSNNPTPPALGKNVFKGVNTIATQLIANTCAYAEADQWKDFIKNADLVACGKKANFAFNNYLTTEPQINVYPNPNNGLFSINLGNISEGSIEISNINGGIIYSKKFNGINEIYVDIQTQPSGIYIVNVISNQTVITKKIIKN